MSRNTANVADLYYRVLVQIEFSNQLKKSMMENSDPKPLWYAMIILFVSKKYFSLKVTGLPAPKNHSF